MSAERSIPHLRDIFGLNSYTSSSSLINSQNNSASQSYYGNGTHDITANIGLQSPIDPQLATVDVKKQSKRKQRDNNSKTLTSGDVKTLERHLSMKKTIRKKIMRDLQQAFVDDPNEFKVDNSNSEHLKSEINAEALRFGEHPTKKSDNFLVMLRGDQKSSYEYANKQAQNREYDYDSPEPERDEKQSFWKRFTTKNKTKR